MAFNIIISISLSILIIFILHNLFYFFQNNLTCPKVKDFINKPNNKYKEIAEIIENNNITSDFSNKNNNSENISTTNIEEIPISSFTQFENKNDKMKSELKSFLNNLNT